MWEHRDKLYWLDWKSQHFNGNVTKWNSIQPSLKCIWQIFFICLIKSPQCTDMYSKKTFSRAIFLWRHFRTSSFAKTDFWHFLKNNALLYHFLANWLAQNRKMIEKSVFRKTWSSEMTSQSFSVSCFWSRSFVTHQKWNLMLLIHQNTGKENH